VDPPGTFCEDFRTAPVRRIASYSYDRMQQSRLMRRLRLKLRTFMLATAIVAALIAMAVESRRRAVEPLRNFHAGKVHYFRRLAIQSERDSVIAKQRASLGTPSMTSTGRFYDTPRLASPEEWADFQSKCEKSTALFCMMAERHTLRLKGYQRSIHRPLEPTPPDPYAEADLSK
jgi:hypothetical protein